MDIDKARVYLAAQRRQAEERRQAREFEITRPTPTQDENDRMAGGELTMLKL
jgi:hypothetical protein